MADHAVRLADPADLDRLPDLERRCDGVLAAYFGSSLPDAVLPTGAQRAAQPGFLLVVGKPAVGFAHVLTRDGVAHLDQLCVLPENARRGLGAALLRSAMGEAASRGMTGMSLTTYADVPFNAPFYARHGFVTLPHTPPPLEQQRAKEQAEGWDDLGPRVVMFRPIGAPVIPAAAVSVIPLRDGADGLEVFVQHRVATMDFAAGAVVYPGGRVDPQDTAAPVDLAADALGALADALAGTAYVGESLDPHAAARTLVACGVRELREETGVEADAGQLVPWDNWVTPPGLPKRFDVVFFVLHLPAGQGWMPTNTTTEAHLAQWTPARDILEAAARGDLRLMTPNRVILEELAALGSASAVLARDPRIEAVHLERSAPRPRPSRTPRAADARP